MKKNKQNKLKQILRDKEGEPILDTNGNFIYLEMEETHYMKKNKHTLKKLRNLVEECGEYIDLIPHKNDNIVQKGLKIISLTERVTSLLFPPEDVNVYDEYAEAHNLLTRRDSDFINLIYNTPLKELFNEDAIDLRNNRKLYKVTSEFGVLYLKEKMELSPITDDENRPTASRSGRFWYQEGFKFEDTLIRLWDLFDNRINMSIKNDDIEYLPLSLSHNPYYGQAQKWVEILAAKHEEYKKDRVPRACLFLGPPGVGKSTLVAKLAQLVGYRTLRLEAEALRYMDMAGMKFLLGTLKPDCLIIDDVDRCSDSQVVAGARLFSVLDWMKETFPETPLFMTANRVSHLDSAFARPGRIDEVYWFELPDAKDRLELLQGYLSFFDIDLSASEQAQIVEQTEGLAVPWIREIALQLKYESLEGVLALIASMKKLKGTLNYSYGREEEEPQDIGKSLSLLSGAKIDFGKIDSDLMEEMIENTPLEMLDDILDGIDFAEK